VSSEDKKHYTAIIDDILSTADLETISRKKVRQGLEAALGGKDLSEQKASKHGRTVGRRRGAVKHHVLVLKN
jgi:upstream activation factor subunit UAF30